MSKTGHVLGGGAHIQGGQLHHDLVLLDLDQEKPSPQRIPLTFLAHGVELAPTAPHRAAVFEKKGPGACLVDLRERVVLQSIPTPPTRHFYGHGAYSADGTLLYATESYLDRSFEGALIVREVGTLQELGEVPTHGKAPHDCKLVEDGKVMVIANGGGPHGGDDPGSVTWVELSSGKLLDRAVMPEERINAGHLAIAGGDLAVVSAPRDGLPGGAPQLGGVSLRPEGKPLRTASHPPQVIARMLGETLSVVIDERRRIAIATHPLGDAVTVWDLQRSELLELLEVPGPRGVALSLDPEVYLLSHLLGGVPRLTAISAATLRPTGFRVSPSFLTGSHIFVHDLTDLVLRRRIAHERRAPDAPPAAAMV